MEFITMTESNSATLVALCKRGKNVIPAGFLELLAPSMLPQSFHEPSQA